MEQAAKGRNQLAAVDRLDASVGIKTEQLSNKRRLNICSTDQIRAEKLEHSEDMASSGDNLYLKQWQLYSEGIQASSGIRLDYLVSIKAFEDKHSRKEIALMLATGSTQAKWIRKHQSVRKAVDYVNRTALIVYRNKQKKALQSQKHLRQGIEIGD